MRIGIDYRFISAGVTAVNRGVGRYTQQQTREVIKLDPDNQFVLFCPPRANLDLILPEIRSAPNVTVAIIEHSIERINSNPNTPERALRFAEEFKGWIYKQKVDLYHSTTPFLLNDTIYTHFDVCPMVATFYDAIPLIFPNSYLLPNTPTTDLYLRAAHLLLSANRFIAISESARQDAIHYFGFPHDRIDLAYPIADPWFQPLSKEDIHRSLHKLRQRILLPDEYIMAVPHLHHSKNFETLIASYALLPIPFRKKLPLVITCYFNDIEKESVMKLITQYGVRQDVIITGFVTETELVALYNQTTVFLHVSLYEGFGLPVLEAMRCGAPVITSNTSSLPEVGGDAVVLIDPNDRKDIAIAIEEVCGSPSRRMEMKQRGLLRAGHFSPYELGQNTWNSYARAIEPLSQPEDPPVRLAIWTPLPPLPSGVADYSVELLEQLKPKFDLEIFVDDNYLPDFELLRHYKIHHFSAFARRQSQKSFDLNVYQLGASSFHAYMYQPLQNYPGLVTLHDLTWGYGLYSWLVTKQQRLEDFRQAILTLEGATALTAFDRISSPNMPDFQRKLFDFLDQHYMLKKVVEHSLRIVVHAEDIEIELKAHFDTPQVRTVHMGVRDPLRNLPIQDPELLRINIGLPTDAFVIGMFGIVDAVKRYDVAFRAFQLFQSRYPNSLLVVVGDTTELSYKQQLTSLAQHLGVSEKIICTGSVPVKAFDQLLVACDVIINLRYPSRKQVSRTLLCAIAAGKPTIVTDLPEWSFVPKDFCWRLIPDANETENLAKFLIQLADDTDLRLRLASQARTYFEQTTNVANMANQYQQIIETLLSKKATIIAQPFTHPRLPLNKIAEMEDWSSPEMAQWLGEVYPTELNSKEHSLKNEPYPRTYWESAMLARGLHFGKALHSNARVLGIGSESWSLIKYLSSKAQQVFSIVNYARSPSANWATLLAPDKMLPSGSEATRLVVQYMDAQFLRFPNDFFDGVFICGLTWQVGDLDSLAQVLHEVGRVLKPNGILSITLNFFLKGPPGARTWDPNLPLLTWEEIQEYVIVASKLKLVDQVHLEASPATLAHYRNPVTRVSEFTTSKWTTEIIQVVEGFVFCPLHLCLVKDDTYNIEITHHQQIDYQKYTNGYKVSETILATLTAFQKSYKPIKMLNLESWSSVTQHLSKAKSEPKPTSLFLRTLRYWLTEDRLIRIKWYYAQFLKRLPCSIAHRINEVFFRLGIVETQQL